MERTKPALNPKKETVIRHVLAINKIIPPEYLRKLPNDILICFTHPLERENYRKYLEE